MNLPMLSQPILRALHQGLVIPAHPLALNRQRKLDEKHQRALTRYYLDAGAGGIAVAVHTTQFEIRKPEIGLFTPVLELAREEVDQFVSRAGTPVVKIAGIIGSTAQAVREAEIAAQLGYHVGLLSLAAMANATNKSLIAHCRAVSEVIPIMGFYLQTAVGGRRLDVDFWREFCRIENVFAIKVAPFNRYHTLDVVRGVAESGRADEIALYTGNDDNIVADLLTEYSIPVGGKIVKKRFVGGLLGHWAVWTKKAFEQLEKIKQNDDVPQLLKLGVEITDANAAFFDVAHNFAGCIIGIHEVLRRQGLLQSSWTLNAAEQLSPQQAEEIDRVYAAYPQLNDDDFVKENLDKWLI
ncbi:MAG: dihydrodipicolinate synthase family protein [bacterium]|nr:dihydrodipicolinate synthase family protein [bacterium]